MTTSLASYLLANHGCDLLVRGIKEPWMFSNDRDEAARLLAHRVAACPQARMFLDASTSYGSSAEALQAIASAGIDYRIVVCLRNQFDRTVSAYKYYRALLTLRIDEGIDALQSESGEPPLLAALGRAPRLANSFLRTGAQCYFRAFGKLPTEMGGPDLGLWMAEANEGVPAHFVAPPVGKYFGTANMVAVSGADRVQPAAVDEADRECALIAAQSLPERIMHELRVLKQRGAFPCVSILSNSFFGPVIAQLLQIVDPARVLLVSMETAAGATELAPNMARFLGGPAPATDSAFPRSNDTAGHASLVDARQLRRAELLIRDGLLADTAALRDAVGRHRTLDLSLFNPDRLYH